MKYFKHWCNKQIHLFHDWKESDQAGTVSAADMSGVFQDLHFHQIHRNYLSNSSQETWLKP